MMIVTIKKLKEQKKNVIKRRLVIKNYIYCMLNDKIIVKSQQRFKSDYQYNVCTDQIQKIALGSNDD